MKFSSVADAFEQISKESSRTEITKLLAQLFEKAGPQEIEIICNFCLGLLRPPYRGTQFNVAEKSMMVAVAHTLQEPVSYVVQLSKQRGDIGLVVEQGTGKPEQQLTVKEVYQELCNIEKLSGIGSQEEREQRIAQLLRNLEPTGGKYVVRIILGTLRLGFSDMTLLDALSWMMTGDKSLRKRIEHAYNICADIGLVAFTLKSGGMEAIDHMHIKVGIPILPAAAERLPTAQAIVERLGHCIAQPKLDGFRLQIHVDKTAAIPSVHFFSRNLIDMSYMFPDIVHIVETLPVKELICEGEAIVYDPHSGHFLPFQETVKRKRKHGIEEAVSEFPLKVFIFDLLYLDGKSYLDVPHYKRREALLNLFKHVNQDAVQVIDEKEINSTKELEDYFLHNIETGLEGLVVKRPDAIYEPGKRNFNWIKLKRQEEGHLEDTLDCVILGYYAGSGKRAQFGIGAFLVGVFNPEKDCFQTIAKIGTGLKDFEWIDLKKRCDHLMVPEKPHNVECPKELFPDVWVAPEIVCSIRADEITLSPLHMTGKTEQRLGYALRFPRFMGYRSDKSAEQATTVHEIHRLFEDQRVIKNKGT